MKLKKTLAKTALTLFTATSIFLSGTGLALAKDKIKTEAQPVKDIPSIEHVYNAPKLEDTINFNIPKLKKDSSVEQGFITDVKEAPKDFWGAIKSLPSKENATILLIGSGLTALLFTQDKNIKDYFAGKGRLGEYSQWGYDLGEYGHISSALALWTGGKLLKNEKLSDTGLAGIEALLTTAVLTEGIKKAVGRTRPRDNTPHGKSFPSGHASSSFAMATVVSDMYDWNWKIAVPAYSLATFVGISRMADNAHYSSDVAAGAAIGILVGKAFADYHKRNNKEQKWFVSPYMNDKVGGFMLTYRF